MTSFERPRTHIVKEEVVVEVQEMAIGAHRNVQVNLAVDYFLLSEKL